MNDTLLDLRIRENGFNRLGKACQAVYACDQDICYATVLQSVQNGKPELCTLVLPYIHAEHVFMPFHTVTVRYVEQSEFYDPDNGEVWAVYEDIPDGANWVERPVKYRDVDYTVAALVTVPSALSYRYYGSDGFILNDRTFVQDSGTSDVMYYAFDTTEAANADMEAFLADYTENINPELDYESKATYAGEFESMRSMFLLLGGALSFIVGLVGVLNFFNAILTGIIARQRELAVLQAVGMTGRQMRAMLVWEGLLYALGAAGLALLLTLLLGPVAFRAVEGLFWFFTYRLDLTPFLLVVPLFALLGAGIPVLTGRAAEKHTVVERLRMP